MTARSPSKFVIVRAKKAERGGGGTSTSSMKVLGIKFLCGSILEQDQKNNISFFFTRKWIKIAINNYSATQAIILQTQ